MKGKVPRWVEYLLTDGLGKEWEGVKGSGGFRHGRKMILVSDIAAQYYCEKKVEFSYTLGRRETEGMREGVRAHEEALEMRRAGPDKIVEGILLGPFPFFASFPILKRVGGFPLMGKPDCVCFGRGRPLFVAELKSWARSFRIHPWHAVQAKLYALLLEEIGFDCSGIKLAVVGVERGKEKGAFMRCAPSILSSAPGSFLEPGDGIRVYLLPYKREEALSALRWAGDYWTGRREALKTHDTRRCRFCEYREECADAEQRKIEEYA